VPVWSASAAALAAAAPVAVSMIAIVLPFPGLAAGNKKTRDEEPCGSGVIRPMADVAMEARHSRRQTPGPDAGRDRYRGRPPDGMP
jgi:hypothetical protein